MKKMKERMDRANIISEEKIAQIFPKLKKTSVHRLKRP